MKMNELTTIECNSNMNKTNVPLKRPHKRLSILVMPTDDCNMNCVYCFHKSHHHTKESSRMTLETLKQLYNITFEEFTDVQIIWHGGEPLIMGLDFYEKAIAMQKEYNHVHIRNLMQSNLTLLTEPMIRFLCEHHIGIGSSLDGVCNDILRGHTDVIMKKWNMLKKSNANCGFIMVLSQKTVDQLLDSYCFFKNIGANFTINTYVPSLNNENDELKLNIEHAFEMLCELFEYWFTDIECPVHIDYFERFIKFIVSRKKSVCKYNSCLGKWIGIRYNGDIMPCNRYFPSEYCFGNVFQYKSISSAFRSEGFNRILTASIERREKCKECEIYPFCEGGCNNVAYNENGINNNGGDSCILARKMYGHICEKVRSVTSRTSAADINPYVAKILHK